MADEVTKRAKQNKNDGTEQAGRSAEADKLKGQGFNIGSLAGPTLTKLVLLLVLAAFLVFIYSRSNAADVNLDTIEKSLNTETGLSKCMTKQSDRDLMQFIGIDAAEYSQVIYYRNTTALAVDELLIVKAVSSDQMAGIAEAVDTRISSQIKAYEGYGPEQVKLLKNAAVREKGLYYFYCTGDKSDKYEEVLLNAI